MGEKEEEIEEETEEETEDLQFKEDAIHDDAYYMRKTALYLNIPMEIFIGVIIIVIVMAIGILTHSYTVESANKRISKAVAKAKSRINLEDPYGYGDVDVPALQPPVPRSRLPSNLVPSHYLFEITAQPDEQSYYFDGYVEITFIVANATDRVILNRDTRRMRIETHFVKLTEGNTSGGEIIANNGHKFLNETYEFICGTPLKMGMNYTISIRYRMQLNVNSFFRANYFNTILGQRRLFFTTNSQLRSARMLFPCFDEPRFKAKFTIRVGRVQGMTSLSNMPKKYTKPMKGTPGWVWDIFETSPPMSTKAVGLVISDFNTHDSPNNEPYQIKMSARNGLINGTMSGVVYIRETVAKITSFLANSFFNIPYPLPKLEVVLVPFFENVAKENWGLIICREPSFLNKSAASFAAIEEVSFEVIISEQISQQWIGNLVTPSESGDFALEDIWLQKGLSSYVGVVALDSIIEKGTKTEEQVSVDNMHTSFLVDSNISSYALNDFQDDEHIYDFSVAKGYSIIRMIAHSLTDVTFKKGLSNYLKEFKYQNATQDDLWGHLTAQAHTDKTLDSSITVKEIMDTWTLAPGYPLITVYKSKGNTIIRQERFFSKNSKNQAKKALKWWVPITFTTNRSPNFTQTKPSLWMRPTETTKIITDVPPGNWVILNVQQIGYYRVNYDHSNWKAITQQLLTDHTVISAVNRAQIIDDAFTLAKANILDYKVPLDIILYLKKEMDYLPWNIALQHLNFIDSMFVHKEAYGYLIEAMVSIVGPVYDNIDFLTIPTKRIQRQLNGKIFAFACLHSYRPCVDTALRLFRSREEISPDYQEAVLCTVAREGGISEWNLLHQEYQSLNSTLDKEVLSVGMSCAKEQWLLNRYIYQTSIANSSILQEHRMKVIKKVAANPYGKLIALQFLKDKWKEIFEYFCVSEYAKVQQCNDLMNSFTANLNTPSQLEDFEKAMKNGVYGINDNFWADYINGVSKQKQKIYDNIAWVKAYYDIINTWLSLRDINMNF